MAVMSRLESLNCAPHNPITLKDMQLENVSHYNYLGVFVDDKLNFNSFLDGQYHKVNARIIN